MNTSSIGAWPNSLDWRLSKYCFVSPLLKKGGNRVWPPLLYYFISMVCLIAALLPFETILYYFFISLKKCDKKHSVGLQSHCKMEKTSSWPSSSRRDRRGAAGGGRSASWAVDQQPSACSKPVNSYLQSTHKSIIRPSEDCQTRADNHKKIVRQDRNLNN